MDRNTSETWSDHLYFTAHSLLFMLRSETLWKGLEHFTQPAISIQLLQTHTRTCFAHYAMQTVPAFQQPQAVGQFYTGSSWAPQIKLSVLQTLPVYKASFS